jgi:serine/alanine adding enzyme
VYSIGAVAGGRLVEVAPSRWDAVLAGLGIADVYASRGFVAASAPLAGGEPLLLHHAEAGGNVVFPAIVRRDPPDVVTPYGYGGPLGPPLPGFADAYADWCAGRGIVSSFVVFHPLYGNGAAAAALGFRPTALAGTVAWPLGAADLLAGMHKHHRRIVRRALADGCEIVAERGPADLSAFVDVYEQTMRRTGAAPFYFFPAAYWEALARDVPLVRVDVRRGGELLASVLGMGEPPWLHYHLGASTEAGRGTGASHLALYGLATWGREHGYDTLHLGGGVGGGADSLLQYKQRFAPGALVEAVIGKAVHDVDAYLALTGERAVDWDGFFPAYREPR